MPLKVGPEFEKINFKIHKNSDLKSNAIFFVAG